MANNFTNIYHDCDWDVTPYIYLVFLIVPIYKVNPYAFDETMTLVRIDGKSSCLGYLQVHMEHDSNVLYGFSIDVHVSN